MRNFRQNPVTSQELMETSWFVVVDNLIGGYAISNADKPTTADLNAAQDEFEIASFMDLTTAQHIVKLHNDAWHAFVWESYYGNILAGTDLDIAHFYHDQEAPLPDGVPPLTEDDWFDYDDDYETTREADLPSRANCQDK